MGAFPDLLFSFLAGIADMSLMGAAVILVICLLRLFLKKAPKRFSYLLWAAAGFRLVCPVSFSSFLSIFNMTSLKTVHTVGPVTAASCFPAAGKQLAASAGALVSPSAGPDRTALYRILAILYLLGLLAMLAAAAVSWLRLQRRVRTAVRLYGCVYECGDIPSPFVLGVLKPKIYIPYGLDAPRTDHVLSHESCHIRRGDPFIKLLAYVILSVHWFNPLVWLAFFLMTEDMEMSCDERVLSQLGEDARRDYGLSLLSLGKYRGFAAGHSPAFGESNIKKRVTNIMKYHKTKGWVSVMAAAICILTIAACSANPTAESEPAESVQPVSESALAPTAESEPAESVQPVSESALSPTAESEPAESAQPVSESTPAPTAEPEKLAQLEADRVVLVKKMEEAQCKVINSTSTKEGWRYVLCSPDIKDREFHLHVAPSLSGDVIYVIDNKLCVEDKK